MQATPALAERREFQDIMNLRSIDCVATRIWFDRRINTRWVALPSCCRSSKESFVVLRAHP